MIPNLFLLLPVLVVLLEYGYIPASPSTFTERASLHLQWGKDGSDWVPLTGRTASDGPVRGVLLHFTEHFVCAEPTITPWVAFVSCDANSTNSSSQVDIFYAAKGCGAKSAVLYSLYSETCDINPDVKRSGLDVFSAQTLEASQRIERKFGASHNTDYKYFNSAMLSSAAEVINAFIATNQPIAPGFLLATLSTDKASSRASRSNNNGSTNGTGPTISASGSSQGTGVAMIILYAITGCVSALFCGVIVSGAIRAIRHPERYGPRRADPALGGGQTRAGGLGRAILDTFPIVKFGSSGNDREASPKDIESARLDANSDTPAPPRDSVQLAEVGHAAEHDEHHVATTSREDNQVPEGTETDQINLPPRRDTVDHRSSLVPARSRDIVPECIGRETCPICIVDFEEGDDLRVLPCEGKHRFHQSCVDPWLLELSASCPICREDFRALENIISGERESEAPPNRNSDSNASMQHNRRFSRYLRFALVRQRRLDSGDGGSPPPPDS